MGVGVMAGKSSTPLPFFAPCISDPSRGAMPASCWMLQEPYERSPARLGSVSTPGSTGGVQLVHNDAFSPNPCRRIYCTLATLSSYLFISVQCKARAVMTISATSTTRMYFAP